MSMKLMVKAMELKVGNSTRKLVLLKLADNANDSGECYPSYKHIADLCEIERRTAMRHIQKLEEDGFLEVEKRKGPKGNSSNIYLLTLDKGGDKKSLGGGDTGSPHSDTGSLGGGDPVSPGISHSFESVNEPSCNVDANASTSKPDKIPYSEIADMFNEIFEKTTLPSVRTLEGSSNYVKKRRRLAAQCWKEVGCSLERMRTYLEDFRNSAKPFYFGMQPGSNWRADFDFLMRPETVEKTRDGRICEVRLHA
ncbi:helix-turn-helix domain-containing protein [Agarivorans sp. B2Z047]|uniref:helix-turn-helix domain-containing protein n=1 Tax=Agarivorans sp. B2Z047 TaxID=2652721 RepID=UPI00128BCF15|nr:helix-turn-helix domain-containing protein [Agarivorans sp. B2Z047]MPW31938.1 helix-turn-helix domain-containing protein [Agarivorans sp. B2Z047]UQN41907.1 helix-turn-helix domain-containing protein [Agarivorans sp. B2Z047]